MMDKHGDVILANTQFGPTFMIGAAALELLLLLNPISLPWDKSSGAMLCSVWAAKEDLWAHLFMTVPVA